MMAANYKTKKDLKSAIGQSLRYTETSAFGAEYRPNGTFCVVGPTPYDRRWYAEVTMTDNRISKVK